MLDFFQPIHPKVVHFPIALFMTALGLDLASLIFKKESLHKAAVLIYVIAALMTPLAVRTGLWEETRLHLNHPLLTKHRTFALWTMWVSLSSLPLLWFLKKKILRYFRFVFFIFLIGAAAFVTLAGHNGGRMVFEYGVGIEK